MRTKHISLFESFGSERYEESKFRSKGSNYVTCITSEGGWSAVGMLSSSQEKYVNQLDPRTIDVVEFQSDSDGDIVVQDGETGEFRLIRNGERYITNYGHPFPILFNQMFVVRSAGHTTMCDVIDPSELSNL